MVHVVCFVTSVQTSAGNPFVLVCRNGSDFNRVTYVAVETRRLSDRNCTVKGILMCY